MQEESPLVVIAGPTGSGKSALAVRIAEEFSGEVINCDSIQVFRYFDLGSAKLGAAERRGVPHHLIGAADPDEPFTAGAYVRAARAALREIRGRGRLPIVAGGTGLYLRALLHGLFSGPPRNVHLRDRLEERERRKPGSLHRLLTRLDPAAARRIHKNDTQKTERALEVRLAGGKTITEFFESGRDALAGFRTLKIVLNPPRAELYAALDERLSQMFGALIEETRGILAMGYPASIKPFESLGYRQALEAIHGRMTREEALAEAQAKTRQYAKRQLTWFRKEADAVWLDGFGTSPATEARAIELVREK